MLVGLDHSQLVYCLLVNYARIDSTYERQSAIVADRNLRLVGVDEDPRVSSRATATVTGHHAVVCPSNWLLVDELYSSVA